MSRLFGGVVEDVKTISKRKLKTSHDLSDHRPIILTAKFFKKTEEQIKREKVEQEDITREKFKEQQKRFGDLLKTSGQKQKRAETGVRKAGISVRRNNKLF